MKIEQEIRLGMRTVHKIMRELNMSPHGKAGLLVTYCGLDGCGKSTQIALLKDYLKQLHLPVLLTKQPTDFIRQSAIFRTYMDRPDHTAYEYRSLSLLAAGDRVQHAAKVILPHLDKKEIVISDRYFYSCLANLRARGYEQDQWIYEIAQCIPEPDLAVFLDVDVETAIERIRGRAEEKDRYIDIPLQHRLRANYMDIAKRSHGVLLPGHLTITEIFENIKARIEPLLMQKCFCEQEAVACLKEN